MPYQYLLLGVVVAVDVENLASISSLLDKHPLVIAQEPLEHAHILENVPLHASPSFLASTPGHPFWELVFAGMLSHRDNVGDPATGSRMLTAAINNYVTHRESQTKPIFVAPADMFCPMVASMDYILQQCEKTSDADLLRFKACTALKNNKNIRVDNFINSLAINHWLNTGQSGVTVPMSYIITSNITKSYNLASDPNDQTSVVKLLNEEKISANTVVPVPVITAEKKSKVVESGPVAFDINAFGEAVKGLPRSKTGIPYIHHYVWIDNNVPSRYEKFIKSWIKLHPDNWHYKLWTDSDALALIDAKFPQFSSFFRNMPYPILKADFIRYCIMTEYGGW